MRAALKDGQLRHIVHDRGADLHAAGTGPNHAHALALQGHAMVPAGGVELSPFEIIQAGQVWDGGYVELSHGTDQHLGLEHTHHTVRPTHLHLPQFVGLHPLRSRDFGVKTHMAADVKSVSAVLEVFPNFIARRKVARPFVVGRKRVLVKVVRRVHATAGVAVLQPSAPHGGIALNDLKRNAQLLEFDAGANARLAGTNDQHFEVLQHLLAGPLAPVDLQGRGLAQAHLVVDQGQVFVGHGLPHAGVHHAVQQRLVGQGRVALPTLARQQKLVELVEQCRLQRRGHLFMEGPRALDVRAIGFQGLRVTTEVHVRHQQGRKVRLRQQGSKVQGRPFSAGGCWQSQRRCRSG